MKQISKRLVSGKSLPLSFSSYSTTMNVVSPSQTDGAFARSLEASPVAWVAQCIGRRRNCGWSVLMRAASAWRHARSDASYFVLPSPRTRRRRPSPLAKERGRSRVHFQSALAEPGAEHVLRAVTDCTIGPPWLFGRVDARLFSTACHEILSARCSRRCASIAMAPAPGGGGRREFQWQQLS